MKTTKRVKKVKHLLKHPHNGYVSSSTMSLGWLNTCECGHITFIPLNNAPEESHIILTPPRKE